MSKLRTYELQNPDSASVNIELTPSGGTVLSGVVTATTLKVGTGVTISSGVVSADSFSGPLTGNVTGNLTGNVSGNVTGNVTGDLTGNVTGNVTGNLTGNLQSTASLAGISSSIADTAVDVFVYDTRKDSDGGAWRKRTQHTSWYNETLNTATRGSRREFPAVAVIVAESNQVTIYDGDDPDLPLWITFPTTDARGVSALNGELCLAANDGLSAYHGLLRIKFIADIAINHRNNTSATVQGYFIYTLSSTDLAKLDDGASSWTGYTSEVPNIVNSDVNDVAMTVLPNAPIDDATGLPIPTIAVATNGGVSVIKDDGTVVDYYHQNATYDVTSFVEFLPDNRVAYAWDDNITPRRLYITPIKSADTQTVDNYSYPIDSVGTVGYGNNLDNKSVGNYHGHLIGSDQSVVASMTGNQLAVGDGSVGLNLVDVQAAGDDTFNSLVAFATTSYNTGWMHGDIKGAFLSDTDATNVTGTELVTNGTFGTGDLTGWTNFDSNRGTLTYSSGKIRFNNDGTGDLYAKVQFTSSPPNGATLHFGGDVTTISGNNANVLKYYFLESDGTTIIGTVIGISLSSVGNGVFSKFDVVVPQANTWGMIISVGSGVSQNAATGDIFEVDNVSLKVLEEADRSVNNKGLQVFGTVTKSAVATGAELVAYSGFSASNYLQQPYNSDLNYGTGDFYFGGWFKGAGYSDSIIGRLHDSSSAGKGFLLSVSSSGGGGLLVFAIYTLGFQSSGRTTILTTTNETGKGWQQVWGIRRGGTMELWLNGNLVTTASNTADISDTTYNPPLFIGVQHGSSVFDGELALMRTGASAPSPEQIKKIYEDEKVLFQENAACTLYGSSDAVTALAYDDSTNLLYAGTSSGRSDFQGLRRINNTTTAVTTAISASNGLVAEQ